MRRLLVLALVALALPASGTAAFPGTNGRLLFTQEGPRLGLYFNPSFVCASTPAGARPTQVVEKPSGPPLASVAAAADGSRIAFMRDAWIHVAEPDGSGDARLVYGNAPAWMPDGSRVVYEIRGDIFSIRPDGTGNAAVTTDPRLERMAAVAPDGRTVAFIRGFGPRGTVVELVLAGIAGGGERVILSRADLGTPDWSPDGSRIALTVAGAVHTVAVDGSDLRALTNGDGDGEPAYSPDGTRVAFERDDDIWIMTATGSNLGNVTHSPLRERSPVWQTGTAAQPAGSDRPCAIVGTGESEELVGSEHDDVFYDLGGNDTVRGLGGNDVVFDGEGNDRIDGGAGDDQIWLSEGSNVTHGGTGDDLIRGVGQAESPVPAVTQQLFGDDGNDHLVGGAVGDRIEGGIGADALYGLKGPDVLLGGPGNDRLAGNRGDDSLIGNQGNDVLDGGLTSGRPFFYDGYDLLVGGEGDDRLAGGWQKDRLFGGPGNDRLSGGPNADHLVGEAGIDMLLGEGGDDLLLARDGRRETVSGGPGFDRARLDRNDRRLGVERAIR